MVQLDPAARLEPQLFAKSKEDASAPVTWILTIVIATLPKLVKLTDCDALLVPTACGP